MIKYLIMINFQLCEYFYLSMRYKIQLKQLKIKKLCRKRDTYKRIFVNTYTDRLAHDASLLDMNLIIIQSINIPDEQDVLPMV